MHEDPIRVPPHGQQMQKQVEAKAKQAKEARDRSEKVAGEKPGRTVAQPQPVPLCRPPLP